MASPSVAQEVTHDMSSKVCVVTGSNTGIGRVTALELARAGAHVIMACRTAERTLPVLEAIRNETGNEQIEFVPLDLASFDSVRACAQELLAKDLPIHVLINNAGLAGHRGITRDGFELAFGTNHLGHVLLTQLLLARIKESAPARIVIVASKGHRLTKKYDLDAVQRSTKTLTGFPEYCVSKVANIFYARELGRRLEGTGVTTYSLHPGVVASDVWRRIPQPIRWLYTRNMISNEEGARTTLHCATHPELAGVTGRYYDECRETDVFPPADDEALCRQTWERSLKWVGLSD